MKNRLILLFCLALIFSAATTVTAQLSKKEKKEWKKQAKGYAKNPESLKQLIEDKQNAESELSSLRQKATQLENSVAGKDSRIAELEDQMSRMRSELSAAQTELAQMKEAPAATSMDFSRGIVFKVQIGAFKNKNLAKYFENNPNFGGEVKEGEPQKITIGIFRDYWEADTFKKYMREMGVKDAWIVPYKDGQRVEIKDVLEGVVSDKSAQTSSR